MNTDDLKLISREELQLRFGLQPAFVKLWMEAKPEDQCPFILLGQLAPKFHAPSFFAWLVKKFGRGDWGALNEPPTDERPPAVLRGPVRKTG